MLIVKCKVCGRENIKDFVNECIYCKTKLDPYNPALEQYQSKSKHNLKNYIQSNIDYACEIKKITKAQLFQNLGIHNDTDISRYTTVQLNDPTIQKLSAFLDLSAEEFAYNDLRLPESCREISQYAGMDAFAMKHLIDIERSGIAKWERLSREDTYEGGKFRQIGFKFISADYELWLIGLQPFTITECDAPFTKLPRMAYQKQKIIVKGLEDYIGKNLYSQYSLYAFLLNCILSSYNINCEDWDTYPEYAQEYVPHRASIGGIRRPLGSDLLSALTEIGDILVNLSNHSKNEEVVREEIKTLQHKFTELEDKRQKEKEQERERQEQKREREKQEKERQKSDTIKMAKELLFSLREKKEFVNDIFGYGCMLYKRGIKSFQEVFIYTGTCLECLGKGIDSIDALLDSEQYVLTYPKIQGREGGAFYFELSNVIDTLAFIENIIQARGIPFVESLLPVYYRKYGINQVSKENIHELWKEIQKIRNRYFDRAHVTDMTLSKDYFSEASYEIAKFIENVRWIGNAPRIPDEFRSKEICLSYINMNQEQFTYYLFWRTQVLLGRPIPSRNIGFLGTFVSELIMQLVVKTKDETIHVLDTIEKEYVGFKPYHVACREWIKEFKYLNGYIGTNPLFGRANYYPHYEPIMENDYTSLTKWILKKSSWKPKNSAFKKKVDCSEHIMEVVKLSIPKLEELFCNNGLTLTDFIIGRLEQATLIEQYYKDSLWTSSTINRVLGIEEFKETYYKPAKLLPSIIKTNSDGSFIRYSSCERGYDDPVLCTFIVRHTEMMFRKLFGYKYISYPEKLTAAMKRGDMYYISSDGDERKREQTYISLYDGIFRIIQNTFEEYIAMKANDINALTDSFNS